MFESDMRCEVFKDYNIPFDEKGNTFGVLRKVQWIKGDKEPDESKARIEIRKMCVNAEEVKALKGYSFSTEEGPSELVHGMIKVGFGDTKQILREVRKRDDFLQAAKTINEDSEDSSDGEMFDMRDLLLGLDSLGSEEEE